MFESYRDFIGTTIKYALYFMAISAAIVVVWLISSAVTIDGETAKRHSDNYQRNANKRIAEYCLDLHPIAATECINQVIKSTREDQRGEYDLNAQKGMERWAFLLLVLSGIGTIVTGIGVVFVALTLAQTANATRLLGQEFITAHPPIIKVFQAHLDFDEISNPTGGAFGGVYTINVGGSDARIAGVGNSKPATYGNIVLFIGRHPPDRKPFDLAPHANPLMVANGTLRAGDSLWWNIVDVSMVKAERIRAVVDGETDDRLFMIGRIHFMDTRGERRQTVFCRAYNPDRRRFTDAGIPDYEYQA